MNAREIMTSRPVQACFEDTPVREVARIMAENDIGAIPVLDSQEHLCGIVTDRDICCRLVAQGKTYDTPVNQVMSADLYTCQPDSDLHEVEDIMREHRVRRLPVVDEQEHVLGVIALADLCHAIHDSPQEHELVEVIESISQPTEGPHT